MLFDDEQQSRRQLFTNEMIQLAQLGLVLIGLYLSTAKMTVFLYQMN